MRFFTVCICKKKWIIILFFKYKIVILYNKRIFKLYQINWGLGIGDWGLGIGDWGFGVWAHNQ